MPFIDIDDLSDLYPAAIVIESFSVTRNARHTAVEGWTAAPGFSGSAAAADVKGHVKFTGGREVQAMGSPSADHSGGIVEGVQTAISTHEIKLNGYYATITPRMRARVGTTVYSIIAVAHTSMKTRTKLLCSLVQ
jgi:hypothetical protein